MPSIVTATQLRTVLGVSVSLYSDAYLEEIINTSEAVILPMLVANVSAIESYSLNANVATFHTVRKHHFVIGQSIVVTALPAPFTATHTVTAVGHYYFTAALVASNVTKRDSLPNGVATLSGYGAADIYASTPAIESAVLAVSVEVFQSRVAAGGQIEGVDFQSSPYRMGRSLTNRVSSLLAPYVDADSVVQ
jgi:hypothetical protein